MNPISFCVGENREQIQIRIQLPVFNLAQSPQRHDTDDHTVFKREIISLLLKLIHKIFCRGSSLIYS